MPTVYLIRHGQDRDNARHILNGHRNQPLTALGKRQARLAAQKLKNKKISAIYSSPLLRCRQTAAIASKTLGGVPITIEPLLIERDFGVLTGRPATDIKKYAKKIIRSHGINYFVSAPKAESFEKTYVRAKRVIKKMEKNRAHENILLVTHNDVGKMMQAVIKKSTPLQSLRTKYIGNAKIIKLMNDKR